METTQDSDGVMLAPSTVRLHFFGDDIKGIIELPERSTLLVIQSAADPRLASVLALVAEHERESDRSEKRNIRRTLLEILENAPVLLSNDQGHLSQPGASVAATDRTESHEN